MASVCDGEKWFAGDDYVGSSDERTSEQSSVDNSPDDVMIGEDDDRVVTLKGLEMIVNCDKKWQYRLLFAASPLRWSQSSCGSISYKEKVAVDIKDWILGRGMSECGTDKKLSTHILVCLVQK